jgi:hypothetical protein
MSDNSITCGQCGAPIIGESQSGDLTQRNPCRRCGSYIRTFAVQVNMQLGVDMTAPASVTVQADVVRANLSAPPTEARFLLDLLLPKADRDAIAGDREEDFRAKLAEYGPRRARLWFWSETVRTIATRNPVCRWVLVYGLVRVLRMLLRMLGS